MYTVELYSELNKISEVEFKDENCAKQWAQKKIDWLESNNPSLNSYAMVWDNSTNKILSYVG